METTYIYGLVEAIACNPNGDVGNDNYPRIIDIGSEKKIEISSYAIKRKMRDFWEDSGKNVILSKENGLKTLPGAYASAFDILKKEGEEIAKFEKGELKELNLTSLTDRILEQYSDSIFGLFNEGRIKGLTSTDLLKIKNFSLSVPSSYSLNDYSDIYQDFRQGNTSHYVSKDGNGQGSIGSYTQIPYGLFPVIGFSLTNYSEEKRKEILEGIYHGFSQNVTATKNFRVKYVFAVTVKDYVKGNFLELSDPKKMTSPTKVEDYKILDSAKLIEISNILILKNGSFRSSQANKLSDLFLELV